MMYSIFRKTLIPILAVFVLYLSFTPLVQGTTYLASSAIVIAAIALIASIKSRTKRMVLVKIICELILIIILTYVVYNKNINTFFSLTEYINYYKENIASALVQIDQSVAPAAATSQINLLLTLTSGILAVAIVNIKNTVVRVFIIAIPGIFATSLAAYADSIIAPLAVLGALILIILDKYEFRKPAFIGRILLLAGTVGAVIIFSTTVVTFPEEPTITANQAQKVGEVGLSDDPMISLQRSLLSRNKNRILDYNGEGTYFKVATLDYFDGEKWSQRLGAGKNVSTIVVKNWRNQLRSFLQKDYQKTRVRVYQASTTNLPTPVNAESVVVLQSLGVDFVFRNKNDNTYKLQNKNQGEILHYISGDFQNVQQKRTLKDVKYESKEIEELNDKEKYLQIPKNLDPYILETAQILTQNSATDKDKIESIVSWFKESGEFSYSIGVIGSYTQNPLLQFLQEKTGYCEQYAGSSAILARLAGVPSRVVVGYTEGEHDATTRKRVVYTSNAHAWIEVWLEDEGWVKYDPTPSSITETESAPIPSEGSAENTASASASSNEVEETESSASTVIELAEALRGRSLDVYDLPPAEMGPAEKVETSSVNQASLLIVYLTVAAVLVFLVFIIVYRYFKKEYKIETVSKYYLKIQKNTKLVNATPYEIGEFLKKYTNVPESQINLWVQNTEKYLYYSGLEITEEEYANLSKNIIKNISTNSRLKI